MKSLIKYRLQKYSELVRNPIGPNIASLGDPLTFNDLTFEEDHLAFNTRARGVFLCMRR